MKKINISILLLFSFINVIAIAPDSFITAELKRVQREIEEAQKKGDVDQEKTLKEEEAKLKHKDGIYRPINTELDKLADNQKKMEANFSLLREMRNEEVRKLAEKAQEKESFKEVLNLEGNETVVLSNEVTGVLEAKIKELQGDGRYGGYEECTKLVNAYADLARLSYIHLDNYPQNKNILKQRLEMLSFGMCQNEWWREKKCTDIVTEAYEKLACLLKLEDKPVAGEQEVPELPEDMYRGIRDLCDHDKSIDWGAKAHILSTISQGLKKRCILEQQQVGGDIGACDELPRKLDAMFYH